MSPTICAAAAPDQRERGTRPRTAAIHNQPGPATPSRCRHHEVSPAPGRDRPTREATARDEREDPDRCEGEPSARGRASRRERAEDVQPGSVCGPSRARDPKRSDATTSGASRLRGGRTDRGHEPHEPTAKWAALQPSLVGPAMPPRSRAGRPSPSGRWRGGDSAARAQPEAPETARSSSQKRERTPPMRPPHSRRPEHDARHQHRDDQRNHDHAPRVDKDVRRAEPCDAATSEGAGCAATALLAARRGREREDEPLVRKVVARVRGRGAVRGRRGSAAERAEEVALSSAPVPGAARRTLSSLRYLRPVRRHRDVPTTNDPGSCREGARQPTRASRAPNPSSAIRCRIVGDGAAAQLSPAAQRAVTGSRTPGCPRAALSTRCAESIGAWSPRTPRAIAVANW